MNKKNILIASLSALMLVLAFILVFNLVIKNKENADDPLNSKTPVADSGELPDMEAIDYEVQEDTALRARFEKYTEDNISELSSEKAVLGGTFFVTNLKWLNNNSALVDYEDGHIALQALVKYNLDDKGEVDVTSFEIIPEEETTNAEGSSMGEPAGEMDVIEKSNNSESEGAPKSIDVEVTLPDFEAIDW